MSNELYQILYMVKARPFEEYAGTLDEALEEVHEAAAAGHWVIGIYEDWNNRAWTPGDEHVELRRRLLVDYYLLEHDPEWQDTPTIKRSIYR